MSMLWLSSICLQLDLVYIPVAMIYEICLKLNLVDLNAYFQHHRGFLDNLVLGNDEDFTSNRFWQVTEEHGVEHQGGPYGRTVRRDGCGPWRRPAISGRRGTRLRCRWRHGVVSVEDRPWHHPSTLEESHLQTCIHTHHMPICKFIDVWWRASTNLGQIVDLYIRPLQQMRLNASTKLLQRNFSTKYG